ncbi:MAG: hypothetical protein OHK0012_14990 [Synechococcales cyanobacterium]
MAEPTDFEVMLHIQGRLPQALTVLQQRYHARLQQMAQALVGDTQHTATVLRRVWLFVWRHADRFDLERERSVALWLYELVAFFSREVQHQRQQRRHITTWAAGFLAVMVGVAGAGYSLYPAWHHWGVSLARTWRGSPDLGELAQRWRQHPQTQTFQLHPLDQQGGSLEALWSPTDRQILVVGSGIPAPPAGMAYQLWAIDTEKQDQPRSHIESGGLLTMIASGSASDAPITWLSNSLLTATPSRLLITLEPQSGNIRPGTAILWDSIPAPVEPAVTEAD